jgi:hypothetical protein
MNFKNKATLKIHDKAIEEALSFLVDIWSSLIEKILMSYNRPVYEENDRLRAVW